MVASKSQIKKRLIYQSKKLVEIKRGVSTKRIIHADAIVDICTILSVTFAEVADLLDSLEDDDESE